MTDTIADAEIADSDSRWSLNESAFTARVKDIINGHIGAGRGILAEWTPDGLVMAIDPKTMMEISTGSSPRTATLEECLKGEVCDRFVTPAGLKAVLESMSQEFEEATGGCVLDKEQVKSIVREMLLGGDGIRIARGAVTGDVTISALPSGGSAADDRFGYTTPNIRYDQHRRRLEVQTSLDGKWHPFTQTLDGTVNLTAYKMAMTPESVGVPGSEDDSWLSGFIWGMFAGAAAIGAGMLFVGVLLP